PPTKALGRDQPPCRRGRATAAPSGKFWMPMPMARAAAPAKPSPPDTRAKASPTAIPSGTLCRVMAVISRVV
ncbi:30S ribosomal protein S6, partial [Dysosmobacter welbionis]